MRNTESTRFIKDEVAQSLTQRIQALKASDPGRFAALKRNTGNTLADSRGCFWFYEFAPPFIAKDDRLIETAFLVATLIPHNRYDSADSLPLAMRKMRPNSEQGRASIDRRFGILLDAAYAPGKDSELIFRLRQIVKLLSSKNTGINWATLLSDLVDWNNPDKIVQKRWARDYFGSEKPEDSPAATDADIDNTHQHPQEEL